MTSNFDSLLFSGSSFLGVIFSHFGSVNVKLLASTFCIRPMGNLGHPYIESASALSDYDDEEIEQSANF